MLSQLNVHAIIIFLSEANSFLSSKSVLHGLATFSKTVKEAFKCENSQIFKQKGFLKIFNIFLNN